MSRACPLGGGVLRVPAAAPAESRCGRQSDRRARLGEPVVEAEGPRPQRSAALASEWSDCPQGQKEMRRPFDVFDVGSGFMSRNQSWKFHVSPGLITVPCGKLVRSGEKSI